MIQQRSGDILEIEEEGEFYYLVVVTNVFMMGANIVYLYHHHGPRLDSVEDLVEERVPGFNAQCDLLRPKKEGRLRRVGKVKNPAKFLKTKYIGVVDAAQAGLENHMQCEALMQVITGDPCPGQDWMIYDMVAKTIDTTRIPPREGDCIGPN